MNTKNPFETLFELLLRHLYSSEEQMYKYLDTLVENANTSKLRNALVHHQRETGDQIDRLKKVFDLLHLDINKTKIEEAEGLLEKGKEVLKTIVTLSAMEKSKGMEGVIRESMEITQHFINSEATDFSIASRSQMIEQMEITFYSTLCLLAKQLGHETVEYLLNISLEEEKEAYRTMTKIALEEIKHFSISAPASNA